MTTENRIRLRIKRLSDAKDDYRWQTDPELTRLDATVPLDMTFQQYISEYTYELCYPSPSRHEFAIETLDGKHIGNCVYYKLDEKESKTEIGILIGDRNYWNKGYGTETITLLLEYIFTRTLLNKVYLTTLDWNIRAQSCFIKCGFSDCGKIVKDDYTFLLMFIQRDEWESLRHQNLQSVKTGMQQSSSKG